MPITVIRFNLNNLWSLNNSRQSSDISDFLYMILLTLYITLYVDMELKANSTSTNCTKTQFEKMVCPFLSKCHITNILFKRYLTVTTTYFDKIKEQFDISKTIQIFLKTIVTLVIKCLCHMPQRSLRGHILHSPLQSF